MRSKARSKNLKKTNGEGDVAKMDEEVKKNVVDKEEAVEMNEASSSQSSDDEFDEAEEEDMEENDDEEMALLEDNVSGMEHLNFEFEALPPDNSDLEGILDLLTQIFLRVNVNCEELAKDVVELAPFGCVFKPSEEYEDDEIGSLVYGVVSVLDLLSEKKCFGEIREFLLQRASKHAEKTIAKVFEDIFSGIGLADGAKRVGLLINERMIHFPPQIAGPAFRSLREDLAGLSKKKQYDYVVMILKIRAGEQKSTTAVGGNNNNNVITGGSGKKKMGKAEKKRLAAAKLESADLIFDNTEEELLFKCANSPTYFQYPVESDVEKSSKFHATVRDGVIYRPYRRVCLLKMDEFVRFSENVESAFS